MKRVDLNCDMGESFGAWTMGDDARVMPLISSANLACGFHGGDAGTMRRTVALALEHGVSIGAHVSLPDLQGFGRREMKISAEEAYELTLYQLGALHAFAVAAGAALAHVKPHGALYNMAAKDASLAAGIARAVRDFDASLVLFGLAGSALIKAGVNAGLAVANEVFADRSYERDGTLTPRTLPGAVLHEPAAAAARALAFVHEGSVVARTGEPVAVRADTLCLHGDGSDAVAFARAIRSAFEAGGVAIAAPARRGAALDRRGDARGDRMNLWPLFGIAVVVLGLVLRQNALLVVVLAGLASGLAAELPLGELLGVIGDSFLKNRFLLVFVLTLPVIGLCERHGLREHAQAWIARLRAVTASRLLLAYLALRQGAAMLGLTSLGGHAQVVRPLLAPMAEGAAIERHGALDVATRDRLLAYCAATDNVGVFFGEDVFVAFGAVLLMQAFLAENGIVAEPFAIAIWGLPTALAAFAIHGLRTLRLDGALARAAAARDGAGRRGRSP